MHRSRLRGLEEKLELADQEKEQIAKHHQSRAGQLEEELAAANRASQALKKEMEDRHMPHHACLINVYIYKNDTYIYILYMIYIYYMICII